MWMHALSSRIEMVGKRCNVVSVDFHHNFFALKFYSDARMFIFSYNKSEWIKIRKNKTNKN